MSHWYAAHHIRPARHRALVRSALRRARSAGSPGRRHAADRRRDPIPAERARRQRGARPSLAPDPARYGVGKVADQPVTMSDGTVLRADVYYPTDPDRQARAGPVPGRADPDAVRQGRARARTPASAARPGRTRTSSSAATSTSSPTCAAPAIRRASSACSTRCRTATASTLVQLGGAAARLRRQGRAVRRVLPRHRPTAHRRRAARRTAR